MSTHQEYWDACLIRAWRQNQNLFTAIQNFESIVGHKITDINLYRFTPNCIRWKVGAKVFVARYLPKINDWLWSHGPERDVDLLHKLSTSKYDTSKTAFVTGADKALHKEQKDVRKIREKRTLLTHVISNRNSATDWRVTKGAVRIKIAR